MPGSENLNPFLKSFNPLTGNPVDASDSVCAADTGSQPIAMKPVREKKYDNEYLAELFRPKNLSANSGPLSQFALNDGIVPPLAGYYVISGENICTFTTTTSDLNGFEDSTVYLEPNPQFSPIDFDYIDQAPVSAKPEKLAPELPTFTLNAKRKICLEDE